MFDLENLEGFKVSRDLGSYTSLIYGVPKIGKTSFAYKMFGQEALFLAFEQGYKTLGGIKVADITKWSDLGKLNKDLKKETVKAKFKVLVIDTADIMDKLAKDYILSSNGIDDMSKLPFGKAYELKDNIMFNMIKSWQDMGYGIMFISHAKEVKIKIEINDEETTKFQPSMERRTLGIISKMCDIIGFGYLVNNEETNKEERVLFLRESLRVQAGTRFKYMPSSVPLEAKAFNDALTKAIEMQENENPDFMTDERIGSVIDTDLIFEDIMELIVDLVKNKLSPAGHMNEVTKIVETHLGVGSKVTEAVKGQVESCDMILTELENLVVELAL